MIIVQYHIGEIRGERQNCVQQLKASLPENIKYELITKEIKIPEYKGKKSIRKDSGFVRLILLKENPDRIWVDTDITCNKWPLIEEGKPHIYGGKCSASIMYLKGFNNIDLLIKEFQKSYYLCMHYLLYKRVKFSLIPADNFNHLQLGSKMRPIDE